MATLAEALRGMLSPEELNKLLDAVTKAAIGAGVETVTSGAISVNTQLTKVSVTGTQAYTLADGQFLGQRKSLRCTVAATTPDGTVTPDNFADGSTITLDAIGEQIELEWQADGWHVVSLTGATVNA